MSTPMHVHFSKNRFQRKCERGLFSFERELRADLDEGRDKREARQSKWRCLPLPFGVGRLVFGV
jgi:hypothetical protein